LTNLRHQTSGRPADALDDVDVHAAGQEVEASFHMTCGTLAEFR